MKQNNMCMDWDTRLLRSNGTFISVGCVSGRFTHKGKSKTLREVEAPPIKLLSGNVFNAEAEVLAVYALPIQEVAESGFPTAEKSQHRSNNPKPKSQVAYSSEDFKQAEGRLLRTLTPSGEYVGYSEQQSNEGNSRGKE